MAVPNFADSTLDSHEIEALLDEMRMVAFPAGYFISRAGKPTTQAIYLQLDGKVEIINEEEASVLIFTKDHFGGDSLRHTGNAEFFSPSNIQVLEDTRCYKLDREAIEKVLGSLSRLAQPLTPSFIKLDRDIQLKDLKLLRILGQGAYGRVWLSQHIQYPERVYALKVMDKKEIATYQMVAYVKREKNVLASIEHPFVVNLVTCFQDNKSLYMLTDFLQGGELDTLLYRKFDGISLSNDTAVFYGACIYEAIGYLHQKNICYRDLKPENVMLDKSGYAILIDMGFAKVTMDKTYTICGSPEYTAPEVVLGTGVLRSWKEANVSPSCSLTRPLLWSHICAPFLRSC